ncbi:MAG: FecR domain-containing protein [Tannerella sp.]|jgi:ferric-dicitrate binding protein FerR (iron transport regulator)|nr:FecR domain-containing protein [Tannerella sp.]
MSLNIDSLNDEKNSPDAVNNVKLRKLTPDEKAELWQRIMATLRKNKRTHARLIFMRYAAAVAILVVAATWLYVRYSPKQEKATDYQALVSNIYTSDNLPENVTLILPNSEKIEIADDNVEVVHESGGTLRINRNIVEDKTNGNAQADDFNYLFVPYGRTTSVVMSDGTKMWVNSGSRVVYPAVFADNKREIYVEGEVYLEVARDEQAPFTVKTDRMDVQVLGTIFNVSAYRGDAGYSVVLAEGSVAVKGANETQATHIRPNQKYSLNKNTQKSSVETVDVDDYICWRYGFLSFNKATLTTVLNRVERYYNVRIIYNAAETDQTIVSGKLDLKEDIGETFRAIAVTASIEFEINTNEITVKL